jgi:hypothetical protein
MQERSVAHSTFVIKRIYSASPERVFSAFSDPGKKRCWFAEGKGSRSNPSRWIFVCRRPGAGLFSPSRRSSLPE